MPTDLQRIEDKIDDVRKELNDLRVLMERRVTAIEVKAGILGVLAGGVGGFFARIVGS